MTLSFSVYIYIYIRNIHVFPKKEKRNIHFFRLEIFFHPRQIFNKKKKKILGKKKKKKKLLYKNATKLTQLLTDFSYEF